jgi:hypothetical protein
MMGLVIWNGVMMMGRKTYSTRGNANQAARNACKKLLGNTFCAFEGPDYEIHPESSLYGLRSDQRYYFKLTGAWLSEVEA